MLVALASLWPRLSGPIAALVTGLLHAPTLQLLYRFIQFKEFPVLHRDLPGQVSLFGLPNLLSQVLPALTEQEHALQLFL
jgi:exonuclease V gamma subunit